MSESGGTSTRRSRGRILAGVAAVVVVAGAFSAVMDHRLGPGAQEAPRFAAEDLFERGRTIRLEEFRGRPVVLNFWASWCAPCLREMPALEQAHARHSGEVVFLGVNHEDDRESAIAVIEDTRVTYASVFDPAGKIGRSYGLFGMPTTVFITADGQIAGQRTGELTVAELDEAIEKHF